MHDFKGKRFFFGHTREHNAKTRRLTCAKQSRAKKYNSPITMGKKIPQKNMLGKRQQVGRQKLYQPCFKKNGGKILDNMHF